MPQKAPRYFKSLEALFKHHLNLSSKPGAVERDLKVFQKKQSITALAKEIDNLHIHIGSWKKFQSKTSLRRALQDNKSGYKRFPLDDAKSFKVLKACLVIIGGFGRGARNS